MDSPPSCDPRDVSLKSFFLGPQGENGAWVASMISGMLEDWFRWRASRYPEDGRAISRADQELPEFQARRERFERDVRELLVRYERETPKFSPRYVGHMFSEISLPALFGHVITLLHNPNLVSAESAPVGVTIEREAICVLSRMIGFGDSSYGHFTSGGTTANFEALVRARERSARWLASSALRAARGGRRAGIFVAAHQGWQAAGAEASDPAAAPFDWTRTGALAAAPAIERALGARLPQPVILVPRTRHYSWQKGASLLGLGDDALWEIPIDADGRLSVDGLRRLIERARAQERPILAVVSVAGTTELGTIDPIDGVQELLDELRERHGIHVWHHVDAAYGGFFRTIGGSKSDALSPGAWRALEAIGRADSVTLDPHKLGYVPYSCGAFLARDARSYLTRQFDSPYIQHSEPMDRGRYTLEGSRSAAGATATWLTSRAIGFDPEGYGRILARTVRTRALLGAKLAATLAHARIAPGCDSNILCFHLARPGEPLSTSNARAERLHQSLSPEANGPFIVSRTSLSLERHREYLARFLGTWDARVDARECVLIRLCLMNPFFSSAEMSRDFTSELIASIERNSRDSQGVPVRLRPEDWI